MTDRRYCKHCDDLTLVVRRNFKTDTWFYGCTNYPSCTHTMQMGEAGEPETPETTSTRLTDQEVCAADQAMLDGSQLTGTSALEHLAEKYNVPGPAAELALMKAAIPGFGKSVDELSKSEREVRAAYFRARCIELGLSKFADLVGVDS